MSNKSTEVAVKTEGALAALPEELNFLSAEDLAMGAAGFEGVDKDSFAIPFIQILQKMSPVVDEDSSAYIEGAKAGMFMNTVSQKLFDGKKGIKIIPCAFKRSFIQWGARNASGGFKGEMTPEEFEAIRSDKSRVIEVDGKFYAPLEDGSVDPKKSDYYADTRSHYVILLDEETGEYSRCILSLSSSQIKSSKKLMTQLQGKKINAGGKMVTPPTFLNFARATTIGLSNDNGSWSGIVFDLEGLVTDKHLFEEAKAFYAQVRGGEVAADYSKAGGDHAAAAGDVADNPTEAEGF